MGKGTTGIQLIKVRDAAKYLKINRTAPDDKGLSDPKCKVAEVGESWARLMSPSNSWLTSPQLCCQEGKSSSLPASIHLKNPRKVGWDTANSLFPTSLPQANLRSWEPGCYYQYMEPGCYYQYTLGQVLTFIQITAGREVTAKGRWQLSFRPHVRCSSSKQRGLLYAKERRGWGKTE